VIIVDLNLLLYAVNEQAPDHLEARRWWESALNGDRTVGLTWLVILGFLRLTTHPRVMPHPIAHDDALRVVEGWLQQPPTEIVSPTPRHWEILRSLLQPLSTAGNLTSDAHLAAIAIEHGAELCSADSDFSRFRQLNWVNPLARSSSR